jgi:hypothetical protein
MRVVEATQLGGPEVLVIREAPRNGSSTGTRYSCNYPQIAMDCKRLGPGLSAIAIAAVCCFAVPAGASAARVQTASADGVQATLTTQPIPGEAPVPGEEPGPVKLAIVDDGQTGFDGPLGVPCDSCALNPPGSGSNALQVRELDSSGVPQVLVYLADDFDTTLAIYQRDAAGGYHPVLLRGFVVTGTLTTDTSVRRVGSGPPVLLSDDPRYLQFNTGGEFYAALPLVAWSYDEGKLTDVSARNPTLLRTEATRALREARRDERIRRSGTDAEDNPDARAALAVYAADETRLGHRGTAERMLQQALADGWLNGPRKPRQAGYIKALNRLLGTVDRDPAKL